MAIKQVSHIAINSIDMGKSIHFYCKILGLELGKTVDMGECVLTYVNLPDGSSIELFDFKDRSFYNCLSEKENTLKHIAFEVTDVEEMNERLKKNAVPFEMELCELTPLKVKALLCKDPNGVVVELSQKMN